MKKSFVLLFCMGIILSVSAEEKFCINGVDEPQWKDFVPVAYVDVKEPKGIGKFNETAKYWYKRKVEFEKNIENCRSIENNDEKVSCYQDLKVKQYQKNSDYNARLEAIEQVQKYPQEMYDRTNNMLPISNYLNNFSYFQPNELRGY